MKKIFVEGVLCVMKNYRCFLPCKDTMWAEFTVPGRSRARPRDGSAASGAPPNTTPLLGHAYATPQRHIANR